TKLLAADALGDIAYRVRHHQRQSNSRSAGDPAKVLRRDNRPKIRKVPRPPSAPCSLWPLTHKLSGPRAPTHPQRRDISASLAVEPTDTECHRRRRILFFSEVRHARSGPRYLAEWRGSGKWAARRGPGLHRLPRRMSVNTQELEQIDRLQS